MSQTSSAEDAFNQLFMEACQNQQSGFLDAAISAYKKLLESFPQAPVLHYNLGLVYYEQGAFQSGCDAFHKAASLSPEDNDIRFNLALSLKKSGDVEGAISSFHDVLSIEPESVDTLYNLAGCYRETHRYSDAVKTYLRVLSLEPEHRPATNNLAYTYHLLGEDDKSAMYYSKVLKYDPDHKAAQHMLTALTGSAAESVPESYIADVFDSYSQRYEQSLVTDLQYNVPGQLRTRFNTLNWSERFDRGLDLGCGTGLSGESFTDIVERFDGIDLSENMLHLAREKNIYQTLHNGNIVNFLGKTEDIFDFYIAADVFGYLGDLKELFVLLRERAHSRTLFCFSTEKSRGNGFQLRSTGRFAHSCAYIERLAVASDWLLLDRQNQRIRKERDSWVEGCLWFFAACQQGR